MSHNQFIMRFDELSHQFEEQHDVSSLDEIDWLIQQSVQTISLADVTKLEGLKGKLIKEGKQFASHPVVQRINHICSSLTSGSTFLDLPKDLILTILSEVIKSGKAANVYLLNKQFKEILSNPNHPLLLKLAMQEGVFIDFKILIKWVENYGKGITYCKLPAEGYTHTEMIKILSKCPNLREISFENRQRVTDQFLIELCQACPNLRILNLDRVGVTQHDVQKDGSSAAKKINRNAEVLMYLFEHLKQLESIKVNNTFTPEQECLLTSQSLQRLEGNFPNFRSLSIQGSPITEIGIQEFAEKFSALESLSLVGLGRPVINGQISEVYIVADEIMQAIQMLEHLKFLELHGSSLSSAALESIGQRLNGLHSLTLMRDATFSDEGLSVEDISTCLARLNKLENLTLNGFVNIDDDFAEKLAPHLTSLRSLTLKEVKMSNQGIENFVHHLPQLKKLEIKIYEPTTHQIGYEDFDSDSDNAFDSESDDEI